MTKERISSDVDRKLRIELDAKANALGISRAKLIEIALKSELGHFNVHKENKRLTEAKARLERQVSELTDTCDDLESQKNQLTVQHSDRTNEIASALGVPNTLGHIKQRIDELQSAQNQLKQEKIELTEQRDEFEKLLHAETDAYNKCHERAESLKKERNTLKEKVQIAEKQLATDEQRYQSVSDGLRKQRDTFKTKFEEAESNYRACGEKLRLLMTRNWWDRLWNKLPWITEISLPTDETIE